MVEWLPIDSDAKCTGAVLLKIKGHDKCALGYWNRSDRNWSIIYSDEYIVSADDEQVEGWSPMPSTNEAQR